MRVRVRVRVTVRVRVRLRLRVRVRVGVRVSHRRAGDGEHIGLLHRVERQDGARHVGRAVLAAALAARLR